MRGTRRMTDDRRALDILERLVAGGQWRRVHLTGPGARGLGRARIERTWSERGQQYSTTITAAWIRQRVRELRRTRQCRTCGQLLP